MPASGPNATVTRRRSDIALDLARFTGSERWYRHWSSPTIIYSEGVRHLAEEAAAYWLIDAIASHLVHDRALIARRTSDEAFDHLHFWYLTKHEDDSLYYTKLNSDGTVDKTIVDVDTGTVSDDKPSDWWLP